jgi:hypothetical protein
MTIYFDYPGKNKEIYVQMNENEEIIFFPGTKHEFKFEESIHYISYAISHNSFYMTSNQIYSKLNTWDDFDIERLFALNFNYKRKSGNLIDPFEPCRRLLFTCGEYIPPAGKYFYWTYPDDVYMYIGPNLIVRVTKNSKQVFGEKVLYYVGYRFMSVDEIIKYKPVLQQYEPYLQWLQEQKDLGKIKQKGDNFSINQQELKRFIE